MSISKKQLDDYYTEHYDRLYKITEGIIIKNKSKVTPETVLSECYINMTKKLDKIQEDKIGNFITSYARTGTAFSNNPLAKEVNYNYRDQQWTQNFTEKVFDDYDADEYFCYIDETIPDTLDSIIDNKYSINPNEYTYEWLLDKIKEYTKTLNIVDKLAAPLLFDSIVYKTINWEEYDIEQRDISLYKEILKRIKTNFIKKYGKQNIL